VRQRFREAGFAGLAALPFQYRRFEDGALMVGKRNPALYLDPAVQGGISLFRRILAWMTERANVPQVLVGDLNSQPTHPAVRVVAERLRSAYALVHGREPDATFPTPLSEEYGTFSVVIDYIFVNGLVQVHDAWLTFDRVDPKDPRLAPSDHYGLAAAVSVRSAE
jgi:endonuclease/exonuclease/phosphatase family metal-dependent hydrolase